MFIKIFLNLMGFWGLYITGCVRCQNTFRKIILKIIGVGNVKNNIIFFRSFFHAFCSNFWWNVWVYFWILFLSISVRYFGILGPNRFIIIFIMYIWKSYVRLYIVTVLGVIGTVLGVKFTAVYLYVKSGVSISAFAQSDPFFRIFCFVIRASVSWILFDIYEKKSCFLYPFLHLLVSF